MLQSVHFGSDAGDGDGDGGTVDWEWVGSAG
jgi:hypothetical protein